MLFNSIEFTIFLPIVFLLYWFVFNKNLKAQNLMILIVSYVFYGWWDWRFLSLIAFSSLVDYTVGYNLSKSQNSIKRKLLLITSIGVNLGLLGFFKYYNFFVESFVDSFSLLGSDLNISTLSIILPIGISFYTFQTLSYTIDIYKRKLDPTKDFISFVSFVSFFPQLVAGPIERAKNLLPQFYKKRVFNNTMASNGIKQIVWGLYKKIVIADNCGVLVNDIFENYGNQSSIVLVIGVVLFAFQIYGDFSGYSDIAIGTSRLFGFNLMTNFKFPYFSRDIAEFWRRWHISLTTWFRDYVYIPLGGSRVRKEIAIRNTIIVFVVSGFWHGANWTFIFWGILNAVFFIPLLLSNKNRKNVDSIQNSFFSIRELLNILLTFSLTCIAWIFFRASDLTEAMDYFVKILFFNLEGDNILLSTKMHLLLALISGFNIILLIIFEFRSYRKGLNEVKLSGLGALSLLIVIFYMGAFKNPVEFIYFQF
ncbi:MBOAT family O-acyltransferase [Ancylomarina sp. YFZ004]